MSIKVKRGLAINLPTLEEGELGFTTDSYEMYVGSDNGNILLNNGEILIRRNNGMLQYAQSSRKNQWFDICSLEEIRGDQGVQGIQGIQGVKGDKGDKGERGIQGEKGNPFTYADFTPDQLRALKGEKGDTGAKGERGLTGDKGDRGVGLNYSWSGTRLGVKRDTDAQYTYVDLRGADGRDGKQGERGERGIQGEKGETPSIAHLEQQISDKSKELDTKFNTLTAKQQQDAEVVTARDGEVSLNARLERDLAKGKIHFVDVEGSNISTESQEGYLENVEIHGNTWQDANNLSDIRSVGTKVDGQELYEIPVVSCGKNVFDNTNYDITTNSNTTFNYDVTNNTYTVTYTGAYPYIMFDLTKHLHRFEGKEFISSCKFLNNNSSAKNSLYLEGVDNNGKTIYFNSSNGYGIPKNTLSKLRLKILPNNSSTSLSGVCEIGNIQIEEGTQPTPHKPYKEDKLTILSPVPLEKVGDVADRIICKDGVWGVEKNIGTKVFNGSENWIEYKAYTDDLMQSAYISLSDIVADTKTDILCDRLNPKQSNFIENYIYNRTALAIGVLKSQLKTQNFNGLIAWLKDNNILIKCQTTQPKFIPLPHDQQIKLRTFADRTHIHFDTEIEGTLKAQVPKSLGATVNTHTSQIDNLNKELDRVKKLEESTVSTVTSDKAFTTVGETNQGYFEDVKIEGKTLVNLVTNIGDLNLSYETNIRMVTKYMNRNCSSITIFANVVGNTRPRVQCNFTDGTFKTFDFTDGMYIIDTEKQIKNVMFYIPTASFVEGVDVDISNMVILEGDHTDKDISYFEGLKSVGQDSGEISVENVNPNGNLFDGTLEVGSLNASGDTDWISYVKTGLIRVKPSSEVICKIGKYKGENATSTDIRLAEYDTNKNFIKFSGGTYKATVSDKTHYVKVAKKIETSDDIRVDINAVSDVVVVYGNELHNIPHQSDKKQILYFNPTTQTWEKPVLREWDSIEKHSDGKYYYHKRSGEVVLNGSENWTLHASVYTNHCQFALSVKGWVWNHILLCDKFQSTIYEVEMDVEKILIGGSDNVHIRISKSKAQDVAGFKQWLQANNVTVVYQLAQEEVYECTNLDLITYNGETNLIVSSGAIQPKITLKVLSNVSNIVKLLQEKVYILENKFIKGLQQVLAGDMMSLAHLLYPEDFTLENDTPQVIPYIEEGDINE